MRTGGNRVCQLSKNPVTVQNPRNRRTECASLREQLTSLQLRVLGFRLLVEGEVLVHGSQFNLSSNLVMLRLTTVAQCFVRAFAAQHHYRIVHCG